MKEATVDSTPLLQASKHTNVRKRRAVMAGSILCAIVVVCAVTVSAVVASRRTDHPALKCPLAERIQLSPAGGQRRLVVLPGPKGFGAQPRRDVESTLYSVHVAAVDNNTLVKGSSTDAFVYYVPNETPNVVGVGNATHFAMFDLDDGVAVAVTVTVHDPSPLLPVRNASITPERYGAVVQIVNSTTVRVLLKHPGHYHVALNGFASHDVPLFLFVEPPEDTITVGCPGSSVAIPVPTQNTTNVQYFARGFHHVGTIQVPAGGVLYLAPGAYVNGSIDASAPNGVVIRGRGVLSGSILKVINASNPDRQPDGHRPNAVNFGVVDKCFVDTCWNLLEGITVVYPPGYSTNLITARTVYVTNFKSVAYRFSSDGLAIPNQGVAQQSFLKVNDDSLNAAWASHVLYRDIQFWPGDNAAVMQLSWGAKLGFVVEDVTFQRLDVLGRAGTVAWARSNQLGASSLIAVTQMRGATIQDITIDDVVVYDDMPTLLGISVNVGDPQFGAPWVPGSGPLGTIRSWSIRNLDYRSKEIGIGYRQPPSFDQIPLIQTSKPIKSWVYFALPKDGSVVSNITFSALRVGGQCVANVSQWPGIQIAGPAHLLFDGCP